jgi:hypothetical protein
VKEFLRHGFPHPAAWTASVVHHFREFRSEVVGAAQNEGTWPCNAIPVVSGGSRLQDWSDSLKQLSVCGSAMFVARMCTVGVCAWPLSSSSTVLLRKRSCPM